MASAMTAKSSALTAKLPRRGRRSGSHSQRAGPYAASPATGGKSRYGAATGAATLNRQAGVAERKWVGTANA